MKASYITKDYLFLLLDDYSYFHINYKKEQEIKKGTFEVKEEARASIFTKKFPNSNFIVLNNLSSNNIIILSMNKDKVEYIDLQKDPKEEFFIDSIEDSNVSSIYLFKKKSSISYIVYEIDLLKERELKEISSHVIDEEINILSFKINPYNKKNYFITTKENRIFFLEKNKKTYKWKNDQSLTNLQFSKLVTFFKEAEDEKIHTYNDFNSFLKKGDIMQIYLNIFNNFWTDLSEILLRIKNNLVSLSSLNEKSNDEVSTITNQKVQHYLIMFTIDSEELFLIDAITGEIKLIKKFKNRQLIKIYEDPSKSNNNGNKDIYLIFKEKSFDSNLHSYHLNLDSKELREEKQILEQVRFEEELSEGSDDLLKNEGEKNTIQLSYKNKIGANSNFIQRFVNKFKIKTNNKGLYGIKFSKNRKLSISWSINMKPFHIQYPNIHKNVITTYHSAGKVFYKYIDSNLLLTLTNLSNKTLIVSVILATNGKILHQSSISNVDFSQEILSVFEENMILISYMKKEKNVRRNEIHAIEIMKREIEHSLVQMLEKLFKLNLFTENAYPEHDIIDELQECDLVFLTHTYITSRKIKGLFATKTLLNVENKYFVFLFENNQVFLVDKRAVSPRRPLVIQDKSKPGTNILDPMNSPYIDPELTPYNHLLIFDYKQILNVDFFTNQIENILISPTQFESTFILCAEGANISCFKVSPDKTFDALSVSFSYGQIALFLSLVISIAILLRKYVKKNEFKQIFLNSL